MQGEKNLTLGENLPIETVSSLPSASVRCCQLGTNFIRFVWLVDVSIQDPP
jgi:hypothetical protein